VFLVNTASAESAQIIIERKLLLNLALQKGLTA
jgi:hypothetical protein